MPAESAFPFSERIGRRSFARLSLATAAAIVGGCAVKAEAGPESPVSTTSRIVKSAQKLFIGDYSTGDFSQWASVQNRGYNDDGADYVPTYSATVVNDPVKGNVARFEVRSGDVPDFGGGERSQVGSLASQTGGTEGQTLWYQLSTKFDPAFPQNHADLGWGVTNGWHPGSGGSSPFQWSVGARNGYWSLVTNDQSAPGVYLPTSGSIFETPLNVGQWHNVRMQVNFSKSATAGWIRLWRNGIRQTFANGADTFFGRTLVPGTTTVYYKEGYYRQAMAPPGVVYTTGFRCASDEAAL